MFALLLAAVTVIPPDGTYTYTLDRAGATSITTQVVFARNASGLDVREHADMQGGISTARTFDAALIERGYHLDAAGAALQIDFAPIHATFQYNGQSQDFPIPKGVPPLVIDGLFAPAAILPAMIASTGAAHFAALTTRNPQVIDVPIDATAHPNRPDGVPSGDVSLGLTVMGQTQTLWYNPGTNVLDEFDPAPGTRVRLTAHTTATPTFAPAVKSTPFPTRFPSRDVHFVSKDGTTLAGTLSYPRGAGSFPGVILLQGSGVSDQNETVGPNQVFAELADALNARGYAVLRYNKRLKQVARLGAVEDGVAATTFMRAAPNIDPERLYFLGHSEGGEIVLGIALAGAPLRGVIMLAPLPMNYTAMIERQLARNHVSGAMLTSLRDAEHGPYLASFNDVDPLAEVRAVRLPMLLVHGSEDQHVTDDDLHAFLAAAKAAHPTTFTDVELIGDTHLFARLSPADAAAAVDETTSVPLDPRLIDTLVAWLGAH